MKNNLHIQEAHGIENRINSERCTPRYITIKLLKPKTLRSLESSKKSDKKSPRRLTADLSETMEAGRQ